MLVEFQLSNPENKSLFLTFHRTIIYLTVYFTDASLKKCATFSENEEIRENIIKIKRKF